MLFNHTPSQGCTKPRVRLRGKRVCVWLRRRPRAVGPFLGPSWWGQLGPGPRTLAAKQLRRPRLGDFSSLLELAVLLAQFQPILGARARPRSKQVRSQLSSCSVLNESGWLAVGASVQHGLALQRLDATQSCKGSAQKNANELLKLSGHEPRG